MSEETMQRIGWVVWPAFLAACAAELLFFSLFDPSDLQLFGRPVEVDRMLVYTLGFFAFWALGILSSGLTVFLARPPSRSLRSASDRAAGGMPEA